MTKSDMQKLIATAGGYASNALADIRIIYAEKGFEPFKKPALYAVPALLILYIAIYMPSASKLQSLNNQLTQQQLISMHYAEYEDLRTRFAGHMRNMPLLKDKEEWLNFILTTTSKNNGIVIDSLSAQTETPIGDFSIVSRDVSLNTNYNTLGKWIADIEKSKILIRIVSLTATKDNGRPGQLKVNLKLATIFPKFAGGGESGL